MQGWDLQKGVSDKSHQNFGNIYVMFSNIRKCTSLFIFIRKLFFRI